jgi:radical SAM protein with 4Fe4S-binding SPASM domain
MICALTQGLGKKLRFAHSFLRARLVHVNLQLLYQCNFRCRICDFWSAAYRERRRLSATEVEIISEKLNQLGPQIVSIGGGEPMLHAELPAVVQALARHHFPVMITNGSLVTTDLARELWQAGMVEISVSVDYATAEKHDAQRGVSGAYTRALEALAILQETRTHPEQRVNMISVIMDDNLADVEPLIGICREMGITYLVTLYSHSRGSKPEGAGSEGISQRLLRLKQRHRHFVALRGYLERFSEAAANNGVGHCAAGQNLWNIDSQGNVTVCIDHLDEPMGNLLADDVQVIEQRMRVRHRGNTCRDCWTSCRGSIEALRLGPRRLANLLDYYHMTRPVPLRGRF